MYQILPLLTDKEIAERESSMNKCDFKRAMEIDKKKGAFNQQMNDFVMECNNKRKKICENKQMIEVNKDVISKMKYMNTLTFTGTLKDIEKQMGDYRKKMYGYYSENSALQRENEVIRKEICDEKKRFHYQMVVTKMEVENYQYEEEEKKRKGEESKDPQWKVFLQNINRMPDDVMNIIHSYFTYETRCALLESKYNPLKDLRSAKKYELNTCIYKLYRKYVNGLWEEDPLRKKLMNVWYDFYQTSFIVEKTKNVPCLRDLKYMIQNLIVNFKSNEYHKVCYELYRNVILA